VNAAVPLRARAFSALLFDLDGTLIDSAADIACALNRALAEQQLGGLPAATVRELIGRGVPTLIERALARLLPPGTAVDSARLRAAFDVHYEALYDLQQVRSQLYPGVRSGLAALFERGWPLAVVTNKPTAAALRLLRHLEIAQYLALVVGGDQGLPRKPHPQPLLAACAGLGVPPAAALMIGDSQTDVQAARAAGLAVVCVPYGYNEGADPRALPCDGFIESLSELPALIGAPLPQTS
jgi:phosphoglycolate phosphatase